MIASLRLVWGAGEPLVVSMHSCLCRGTHSHRGNLVSGPLSSFWRQHACSLLPGISGMQPYLTFARSPSRVRSIQGAL